MIIVLFFGIVQIILRFMLIQSRIKHGNKKINNYLSIQKSTSLPTNPQIQGLMSKLFAITETLPQDKPRTLNLIQWEKQRYHPNQIQNRIRIENQIELIKVCNEKTRTRVKPTKRTFSSNAVYMPQKTYKQHYQQIKQSMNRKFSQSQSLDSQEQQQPIPLPSFKSFSNTGIKFYDNLKKYDKIVSYINERRGAKSQTKGRQLTTAHSQINQISKMKNTVLKKNFSSTDKTKMVFLRDKQSNQRLSSIVQKWKPLSKIEKAFSKTSKMRYNKPSVDLSFKSQPLINNTDTIEDNSFIQAPMALTQINDQ